MMEVRISERLEGRVGVIIQPEQGDSFAGVTNLQTCFITTREGREGSTITKEVSRPAWLLTTGLLQLIIHQ